MSTVLYRRMKSMINAKYYKTAEIAQEKLDVFYAVGRLDDEQYEELTALVETKYGN